MRKWLVLLSTLLIVFLSISNKSFAYEIDVVSKDGAKQKMVNEVGFRLLNANKIEKRIVFRYVANKHMVNDYAYPYGKFVAVGKGLLPFFDDEDELAAVLAHEIAHNVDYYNHLLLPMMLSPKKYETKADKRAVDYMVNAGYNPLAMVVFMNKTFPQYKYDLLSSHPLTSKRLANVYEYISIKYPQCLKDNKFKDNTYYQNFLLTSQDNLKKVQEKVANPSKKVKYK